MKKVMQIGLVLLGMTMLWTACGSGDDSEDTPVEGPVMVSTLPADGATGVSAGNITLSVVYDKNISFASADLAKITLTGGTVSAARVNGGVGKELLIDATLDWGKTCTLTVPVGAVTGPLQSQAEQVRISFTVVERPVISQALVNPNAIASARKVYAYLLDNYQRKTLSGMMADVAWNNTESERVYQLTGKYPAINCYDYIHLAWSPANWIDYSNIAPAKTWWEAGGIVAAGWHWNVPASKDITDLNQMTCTPEKTTFRAKNALVEGTWENGIMKADLAKIAGYLKLLQAEGIPVLWRPLHEAAGNIYEYNGGTAWFWWGYDGAEVYRKLWIHMFDYFQSQGLNNLIWVWTTQTKDDAFYPGDAYVDIVGRDLYGPKTAACIAQYGTITNAYGNKIVTLSECGTVGLISEQWTGGARWSWFMPWYDNTDATTRHATDDWWKDAMNQSYVIDRSQLPSLK